jgi:transposase
VTVIQALAALGAGAVATALIGGLFALRKTRSESGKLDADAAKTIVDAAAGLVTPMANQLGALGQRVDVQDRRIDALERDNRRKSDVIRDFLTCGVPNCPIVARVPVDIRNEV